MAVSAEEYKKQKEQDSLQRAIKVLESRVIRLEQQNRSLDALVRRVTGEAQRASQAALKANQEIAQLHNMLSRRS